MPYVNVGYPSLHHGKRLFRLLCQLKDFGRGRIVFRSDEQVHPEPSFYRILLAQPEMDDKMEVGRVVAERVYRGRRMAEPVNLSEEARWPDYRLVRKDDESAFCRWDEVVDYVHERDATPLPKWMEMAPLMKVVVSRNRKLHNESAGDQELRLPAHKVYTGEHRLTDDIESSDLSKLLTDEFATHKDFDMSLVPRDKWNLSRLTSLVNYRAWLHPVEGSADWPKYEKRMEQEREQRQQ